MKKKGLVCLLLLSLFLTGCGKNAGLKAKELTENTLYIGKDGRVVSGIVESFDKEYYVKEELESFIEEEIEACNSRFGEKRIKLSSLMIEEKGQAKMVVEYDSMEDYAVANQTVGSLLSFEEAKEQGLLPDTMKNMADGSSISLEELEAKAEDKVAVFTEEYNVILDGKVLYYQNCAAKSTESVHTSGTETAIIIFK